MRMALQPRLNDKSETAAIKTVFGEQAYNIPVSSTKSMTGHLLGASGAVEAVFCILAIREESCRLRSIIAPPTRNVTWIMYPTSRARHRRRHVMSNSFGFGGHNATLVFSRFEE